MGRQSVSQILEHPLIYTAADQLPPADIPLAMLEDTALFRLWTQAATDHPNISPEERRSRLNVLIRDYNAGLGDVGMIYSSSVSEGSWFEFQCPIKDGHMVASSDEIVEKLFCANCPYQYTEEAFEQVRAYLTNECVRDGKNAPTARLHIVTSQND